VEVLVTCQPSDESSQIGNRGALGHLFARHSPHEHACGAQLQSRIIVMGNLCAAERHRTTSIIFTKLQELG
jgi:hypothetical protein